MRIPPKNKTSPLWGGSWGFGGSAPNLRERKLNEYQLYLTMNKLLQSRRYFRTEFYDVDPIHIQSGLAVTPSEMMTLSEHGVPISSQVDESLFYDGDSSFKVSIDPMQMRGVDINDAWNAEQDSKARLAAAYSKDVKIYGK